MEISLTEEEARVLRAVLEMYLPQLREEVYKTERYELRETLKGGEAVIKALIEKLDRIGVPQS